MRILIVKLTSMGDVLHLMPALTDLHAHYPEAVIDWLVEDSFSDIPTWHKAVNKVIKASTRRWRKVSSQTRKEYAEFKLQLREHEYDVVLDAQGLIKSAWIARKARLSKQGVRAGFSGKSIKESPAALAYQKKVAIDRKQHAVIRLRKLFAGVFEYTYSDDDSPWPNLALDYGLCLPDSEVDNSNTIMLFHGTTWATKHLPDQRWRELCNIIIKAGFNVKLCWGNEIEKRRAYWIAQDRPEVSILDKSTLTQLAQQLNSVRGVVAVDTGLGHLAAALNIPNVSIYGATDSTLTGAVGQNQAHLQSSYHCSPCLAKACRELGSDNALPPCYDEFSAINIWKSLEQQFI